MVGKLVGKLEAWTEEWGVVVFTPTKFFQAGFSTAKTTSIEFFVGVLVFSYVLTFIVSLAFFAAFYANILVDKFPHRAGADLAMISKLFLAYAIVVYVGFMISAVYSYVVARTFGSVSAFAPHFKSYIYLGALEPVAALLSTLIFLNDGLGRGLDGLILLAVILYLGTRIWGGYAGYQAMQQVHISSVRRRLIYGLGFLPSWVLVNSFMAAVVWMMLSWGIVPYWD